MMPTELTFPEGSEQGDLQCEEVEIIDDEAVEDEEHFYVDLSTDDSSVQLLSYYQRRRFGIYDNDGKYIETAKFLCGQLNAQFPMLSVF